MVNMNNFLIKMQKIDTKAVKWEVRPKQQLKKVKRNTVEIIKNAYMR